MGSPIRGLWTGKQGTCISLCLPIRQKSKDGGRGNSGIQTNNNQICGKNQKSDGDKTLSLVEREVKKQWQGEEREKPNAMKTEQADIASLYKKERN